VGSKLIGFRLDNDLAEEIEAKAAEKGQSTSELLRELVDELLYPSRAELDSPEQLYGVKATEQIVEVVNSQIKEQLKEQLGPLVDEKLKLVQVDRGLTEAEKRHYDSALASLESNLGKLKVSVDKLETSAILKSLQPSVKK
jgi:hypothetical protein